MKRVLLASAVVIVPALALAQAPIPGAPGSISVSTSVSGFTPSTSGARGTPITVTTSDSSGTLPTGADTIVGNVGTSNPMYCNVNGVAATTSDQLIPVQSWFEFTIPAGVTTLHCIATGGSTTANMVGGLGIATGSGGGGSGGGGSNAAAGSTGSAVPGSASYNGLNIGGGTLRGQTGSNPSGVVYSAATDLTSVNGVTALAGTGAAGAGSARVAVGTDTSTIAGSSPGTAGTASGNVITVQGIASMTPIQASQSGNWTARVVGNGGAVMDFAGQNASAPANSLLIAGEFNTTPTTITSGNASPLQMDNAGNLLVNVKAGSGSGVSTADEATFTAGSSVFAGAGGFYQTTATSNALTNGQQGMFQVTANRALFTNLRNASGTELGSAGAPLQVSVANTGSNSVAIAVGVSAGADVTEGGLSPTITCSSSWTVNGCLAQIDSDIKGPIAGVSKAQTSAAAANLQVKTSAGSLTSFSGTTASANSYLALVDSATNPTAGGAAMAPLKCWLIPTAGPFVFGWGPGPTLSFSNGMFAVVSSSGCYTNTATNATFMAAEYQ